MIIMPSKFEKIVIVGLGLIGGSLAAAFKRKKIPEQVIGIDEPDVVARARDSKLIDQGFSADAMAEGLREAELIIVATPIKQILSLLPKIAELATPGTLVTDVGSTKEQIVATASNCFPPGVYFLGGHPMTGSEKRGVENADPFLFENAIYVLTEREHVRREALDGFVEVLETIGAKVLFLPAKLHDEIAAVISHLPQFLAVSLVNFAAELDPDESLYLKLAAGGFRDMTRIASSPYDIWADICDTNAQNIREAIRQFIAVLQRTHDALGGPDLERRFVEAARTRLSIPSDTRGFLRPHYDIAVVVEDRPGMIASIATTLADRAINIKDIQVLKVREGDAGTLRLAFESEADRQQAITLLSQKGFQIISKD